MPNPYAASNACLAAREHAGPLLAARGRRLTAKLVDAAPILALIGTAVFLVGQHDDIVESDYAAMATVGIALIAILLIQLVLFYRHGQTIGKRLLHIRVVRSDGSRCSLRRYLLLRLFAINLLSAVPIMGTLLSLTDVLMIFTRSRRCLHDHFADTIVVNA
ncbi:RDD family protein [Chitinimonas sp.]|uniref:RDD family protein n=1 Tax=Chitinimonas sp. TaxID=1934313 RepID=UPI0035AF21D4